MVLSERAEIVIGRNLVNEFTGHEFDHDCVVDEPKAWNFVGNQIVQINEVGEGIEEAPAIGPFEASLDVGQHGDPLFEDPDPLPHEVGRTCSRRSRKKRRSALRSSKETFISTHSLRSARAKFKLRLNSGARFSWEFIFGTVSVFGSIGSSR